MTVEIFQNVLAWNVVINFTILLFWFAMYYFAHDWIYGLHTKFFSLSKDNFDAIHYAGMAYYKLTIFLFFLGPYLALRLFL
jgi:hypothetical protein